MNTYLSPLLFLTNTQEHAKNTILFYSGAALPFCNRIGSYNAISLADINTIKSTFNTTPFRWFVDAQDIATTELLLQQGFFYDRAFPAMHMPLENLQDNSYNKDIVIKHVDPSSLDTWISVILQSYGTQSPEFKKFIMYLVKTTPSDDLQFYLAFYNGLPVGASMTIRFQNIVTLHWVGTIPEYRNKGIGFAVSHYALKGAQKDGCTDAVLFTSPLGEPVYKKIGFTQYAIYNTYGLKIQNSLV